jgi:hypothetical protein
MGFGADFPNEAIFSRKIRLNNRYPMKSARKKDKPGE